MAALAYSQRLSGQLHDAAALYRQALDAAERLVGNDRDMRLAQLVNALAICLRQLAQYKEAEQYYSRALEIRVAHFGELSVDVAQSHNSIGCLHQDLGNYDLSEYHLVRAIELRERLLGAQHPDVAMSLCNLGGLKLAMGKMDEAERLYRRAMAIYVAAYGEQHSGTAQCLNSLAGLAAERRRDVEARRLYAQVLGIRRAVLGNEHPDVAVTLNDMAVMLVREGEHAERRAAVPRGAAHSPHCARAESHRHGVVAAESRPAARRRRALWRGRGDDAGEHAHHAAGARRVARRHCWLLSQLGRSGAEAESV
jgi:tetratricopeptide (TPR) repeat protein